MKRYTIVLTLLMALVNTGCEDAKAETKDYDTEIAELKSQINALNEKIDAMPKTTYYECIVGSDNICTIEIPELDPNDKNVIIRARQSGYSINGDAINILNFWYDGNKERWEKGKFIADWSYSDRSMAGLKYIVSVTK